MRTASRIVVLAMAAPLLAGCLPWAGQVVLSPDGQKVAVSPAPEESMPQSFLVLTRQGKDVGRSGGWGNDMIDTQPAFSPDSKTVAFWRLTERPKPATTEPADEAKAPTKPAAPASVKLVLWDLAAGKQRVLVEWQTTLETDWQVSAGAAPVFTPDARGLLFPRIGESADKIDPRLEIADVATGKTRRLADDCLAGSFISGGKEVLATTLVGGVGKRIREEIKERQDLAKEPPEKAAAKMNEGPKEGPPTVVVILDAATGRQLKRQELPKGASVALATARDGVILSTEFGLAVLGEAQGGLSLLWPKTERTPEYFAFSSDGRWVLAVVNEPALPTTQPATAEDKAGKPQAIPSPPVAKPISDPPPAAPDHRAVYLLDRDRGDWKKLHEAAMPVDIAYPSITADGRTACFLEMENDPKHEGSALLKGRVIVLDAPTGKIVCDRDLKAISAAATQPERP